LEGDVLSSGGGGEADVAAAARVERRSEDMAAAELRAETRSSGSCALKPTSRVAVAHATVQRQRGAAGARIKRLLGTTRARCSCVADAAACCDDPRALRPWICDARVRRAWAGRRSGARVESESEEQARQSFAREVRALCPRRRGEARQGERREGGAGGSVRAAAADARVNRRERRRRRTERCESRSRWERRTDKAWGWQRVSEGYLRWSTGRGSQQQQSAPRGRRQEPAQAQADAARVPAGRRRHSSEAARARAAQGICRRARARATPGHSAAAGVPGVRRRPARPNVRVAPGSAWRLRSLHLARLGLLGGGTPIEERLA
jgi:hypothetical protein